MIAGLPEGSAWSAIKMIDSAGGGRFERTEDGGQGSGIGDPFDRLRTGLRAGICASMSESRSGFPVMVVTRAYMAVPSVMC